MFRISEDGPNACLPKTASTHIGTLPKAGQKNKIVIVRSVLTRYVVVPMAACATGATAASLYSHGTCNGRALLEELAPAATREDTLGEEVARHTDALHDFNSRIDEQNRTISETVARLDELYATVEKHAVD